MVKRNLISYIIYVITITFFLDVSFAKYKYLRFWYQNKKPFNLIKS